MSYRHFLRARFAFLAFIFTTMGICAPASAQTVNWMSWTAPGAYPSSNPAPPYTYTSSATGSLTLPDATVVGVTLSGEVVDQSCFTVTLAGCPAGYWKSTGWSASPAGTFTNANVPALPPNENLITQAGYQNAVHVLTFAQPVTNVVMNIISLGSPAQASAYQFTQDFAILSQDSRCNTTTGERCLVKSGLTLTGKEGGGTIQFLGTYSSISWTVTVPEYYSGFNVGVTSAAPPAAAGATPVPTLSQYSLMLLILCMGTLAFFISRKRQR